MTAAIVIGSLLYAGGHLAVQLGVRDDGLVPTWWVLAIAVVDLSPAAIAVGLGWLWAWPLLAVGLLTAPMAVHVLARRRATADLARLGRQEVTARKMLRRPSPPEVERVLRPLGESPTLIEEARKSHGALRAQYDQVVRDRTRVSA
jgi:hypothetical protein